MVESETHPCNATSQRTSNKDVMKNDRNTGTFYSEKHLCTFPPFPSKTPTTLYHLFSHLLEHKKTSDDMKSPSKIGPLPVSPSHLCCKCANFQNYGCVPGKSNCGSSISGLNTHQSTQNQGDFLSSSA